MTKLTLMRTAVMLEEGKRTAAREFFLQAIDGFSHEDKTVWRRFLGKLFNLEHGELANIEVVIPRNPRFHRKFFALLNLGFDAWNPGRTHKTHNGIPVSKNFDQFREDVTILAGYYEQTYDLAGSMRLKAKSISFANMEDPEFEQLYGEVATVLLEKVLTKYANRAELDQVVNQVLGFL